MIDPIERYRTLFDLGPVAVYSCDASGVIQEYNRRAAELWGCEPAIGDTDRRFCGSFKLFRPDGSFMPHEQCPMAEVVAGTLSEAVDGEVLVERPDGLRITAQRGFDAPFLEFFDAVRATQALAPHGTRRAKAGRRSRRNRSRGPRARARCRLRRIPGQAC